MSRLRTLSESVRLCCALLSFLIGFSAEADTVISQNGFENLRSMKQIEAASCCLVEVSIIETIDDIFVYWTLPQIAHDTPSARADEVWNAWRQKMPGVISGPDSYSYTDEHGDTRDVDLRWAAVHHLAKVETSIRGDYQGGDLIFVEQPGSHLHKVSVQNMEMMAVGQKYLLYLKPAVYWDDGIPVHRISGLSGGMRHISEVKQDR